MAVKRKVKAMLKKPIVLVGAKGFWEVRELVENNVFKSGFELLNTSNFQIAGEKKSEVVAIVVADQPIGARLMDEFPKLRTIARTGTGYDNIDVKAASERKIIISRVAELNAEPVSEFTLGLIFALIRNIVGVHQKMCDSTWDRYKGMLMSELTVGIIGLGAVGRSLARKLHALGVKRLIGWNRTLRPQVMNTALNTHLEIVSLESVLKESDVVVVAVALAPETRNLLDEKLLSLMKKNAYLVNVSRGAVVDENALAEFVTAGEIAGVALDVFSLEPPADNPFQEPFMQKLIESAKNRRNVILSPHNAFRTKNSEEVISLRVAENIVGVLEGNMEGVEVV